MTWTRLSDDFTDRPEMLEVTRSARLLHIEAMVWCNRMLRDGRLPRAALPRISDADDIDHDVTQLEKVGLWSVDGDAGWLLDWSDQESADEVKARAQYRADTQKRYRERKAKHERGDHSACDPRYCKSAVTGNATGNKRGNETPSRPVPSRPQGRDRDQGAEPDSADARRARAAEKDFACSHRSDGFNYKSDGEIRCDLCRPVALKLRQFEMWRAGMKDRDMTVEDAQGLIDQRPYEQTIFSAGLACAAYEQMGGLFTADDSAVDSDLMDYLEAYVLLSLDVYPSTDLSQRRTA